MDNELDGKKLNDDIEKIVLDKNKIKLMGENALKVSSKNVENKIYEQIIETIKIHNEGKNND